MNERHFELLIERLDIIIELLQRPSDASPTGWTDELIMAQIAAADASVATKTGFKL